MIDSAQPPAWGSGVPRGLQEHHEGWALGQPLPAEPALMSPDTPGSAAPVTGVAVTGAPMTGVPGDGAPGNGSHPGSAGEPSAVSTGRGASREDLWAMASYLSAIFFWLPAPLAVYLAMRNRSIFVRSHAAQAFNLTLTATLFAISGGIIGGLLALNSPWAALFIMGPALFAFWIVVLTYLIRAASSASRSDFYEIPSWLCVTALK
jgi:uncharacterized Tic20 family protein